MKDERYKPTPAERYADWVEELDNIPLPEAKACCWMVEDIHLRRGAVKDSAVKYERKLQAREDTGQERTSQQRLRLAKLKILARDASDSRGNYHRSLAEAGKPTRPEDRGKNGRRRASCRPGIGVRIAGQTIQVSTGKDSSPRPFQGLERYAVLRAGTGTVEYLTILDPKTGVYWKTTVEAAKGSYNAFDGPQSLPKGAEPGALLVLGSQLHGQRPVSPELGAATLEERRTELASRQALAEETDRRVNGPSATRMRYGPSATRNRRGRRKRGRNRGKGAKGSKK
jgi:hypothetical protein